MFSALNNAWVGGVSGCLSCATLKMDHEIFHVHCDDISSNFAKFDLIFFPRFPRLLLASSLSSEGNSSTHTDF